MNIAVKKTLYIIAVLTIFITSGCNALTAKEIGRLPINEVSIDDDHLIVKETELLLKKGDQLSIWSDMNIAYQGEVSLLFKLEILKDGEQMGGMEIDPTDKKITIGEFKKQVMDQTDWSFTGRNSGFIVDDDGTYTFRGILVASDNPSLKVSKAEVVFKK